MSRAALGRLLAAAGVTLAVTVGGLGVGAGPSAASSGRCPQGTGVTVVVDYGPLGGGVVTACDPDGAGRAATEVMARTGFDLTYVNQQPGFVCRINGKPDASQESCANTPPPDAYWGLFWSDGDPATWKYSSEGAGGLEVPEGGSIGWRFEDGGDRENPGAAPNTAAPPSSASPSPHPTKSPSSAPPAPSDTAQPTTPTPTPTPSASVPPGTKGSNPAPDRNAKPARKDDQQPRDQQKQKQKGKHDGKKDKQHKKKRHDEVAPSATLSPSPTVEISPASGEPTKSGASSLVLTLIAGGAVLVLGGAAGVIGLRRRV